MSKKSKIEFRIETDLKDQIMELANQSGLYLSDYLRNSISSLVNRKDVLLEIVDDYQQLQDNIELFMNETEIKTVESDKDEIVYHCKRCQPLAFLVMKFTRKSDKFQSKFNVGKFGRGLLKCGEVLYLAVGSSSFYDTAFLRAIEYANKSNIAIIEILALTRSEYETITRSVLIADKVASKISEYHISLKGLDIMMLRIHCVISQNDQIRRMNTTYSNKTSLFWVFLNFGEEKAKTYYQLFKNRGYDKFIERSFEVYKREYKALYELNNLDKDKFRFALSYLMESKLNRYEKEELKAKQKAKREKKNGK